MHLWVEHDDKNFQWKRVLSDTWREISSICFLFFEGQGDVTRNLWSLSSFWFLHGQFNWNSNNITHVSTPCVCFVFDCNVWNDSWPDVSTTKTFFSSFVVSCQNYCFHFDDHSLQRVRAATAKSLTDPQFSSRNLHFKSRTNRPERSANCAR